MPREPAEWQSQVRTAIEAAYGSLNGYAKYLAGDGATQKEVESKRRGIQKWLQIDKPHVPSVQTVTRLLRDGIQIDPAVFPRGLDRPRPYTTAELGELLETALVNQGLARDLIQQLSENIESAVAVGHENGKSIEGLRIAFESLRRDLEPSRSSGQRNRHAS